METCNSYRMGPQADIAIHIRRATCFKNHKKNVAIARVAQGDKEIHGIHKTI